MAQSLPRSAARTHENSLRRDLDEIRAGKANLRIDENSAAFAKEIGGIAPLVREAMRRADLSQKVMAITATERGATCGESNLSEALSGSRHLPVEWLWLQDDRFWIELIALIQQKRRLTADAERAEAIDDIAELLRRILMRKMEKIA